MENNQNIQYEVAEKADLRRMVFVSLIGLHRTYRKCPIHILFSAIFILPMQRKWIHHPYKYLEELIDLSAS